MPEASKGFLSYLVLTDRAYRPTWSSPGRVSCPTLSSQTGTLVLLGPHRQPVRASCPTWSSQAGLPVFPSPHRQPVRASCLNWSSQAGLPVLPGPHRQGFLSYLVLTGSQAGLPVRAHIVVVTDTHDYSKPDGLKVIEEKERVR